MEQQNEQALSYKLEVFEGPLDLLLNLLSKNKIRCKIVTGVRRDVADIT